MNWYRSLILLGIAVLAAGCGGSKDLPRGPVRGRVTLNGKPVAGATIVFESKGVGVAQTATLDSDGRYEFASYGASGLPASLYKVSVSAGRFMQPGEEIPMVAPAAKGAPAPEKKVSVAIPDKYAKADTSGLTADVKAGDNQAFDFDLK
jgi:hypothetical protein